MHILHRDSLPRGGFAGLTETRLVVDQKVGGKETTWDGIGNFVYLADAQYLPHGETTMHSHSEIDVITVMLEGKLSHEGSLEHGQSMQGQQIQVQRAGGEGFAHNEINPDSSRTRILQIWALPETSGEPADYKLYDLSTNKLKRIYGGSKNQNETFDSHTIIEAGVFETDQIIKKQGDFLAYVSSGYGQLNGQSVRDGDLVRGTDLDLLVTQGTLHLTLITEQNKH